MRSSATAVTMIQESLSDIKESIIIMIQEDFLQTMHGTSAEAVAMTMIQIQDKSLSLSVSDQRHQRVFHATATGRFYSDHVHGPDGCVMFVIDSLCPIFVCLQLCLQQHVFRSIDFLQNISVFWQHCVCCSTVGQFVCTSS